MLSRLRAFASGCSCFRFQLAVNLSLLLLRLSSASAIALVVCIIWSIWMIVNPQSYRDFIDAHPNMDPKGTWSDASDAKIRISGVVVILAAMVAMFLILYLLGIV